MPLSVVARRASLRVGANGSRAPRASTRRSLSRFRVVEHVAPAQHTRHWPRGAEVGYEDALKLAVKQYIPEGNPNPRSGDVTIIAAHANGFPKVGVEWG